MCLPLQAIVFMFWFSYYVTSHTILDTGSPIIIYDDGGLHNNLFGYSMTFIKGQFGGSSSTISGNASQVVGTLFIGSPNETRYTNNSGVIWTCPFTTDGHLKCSILLKISNRAARSGKSPCSNESALTYPESEKDQWIGASLSSTPNELFACAPRWKRNGYVDRNYTCINETGLFGTCFKLFTETGMSSNRSKYKLTLSGPFQDPDQQGRLNNKTFWQHFAQYGFSSHVTLSNNFIVGAPSPTAGHWESKKYVLDFGNRTLVHFDMEHHTLLGYSLTSGRTRVGGEFVAAGAPRGSNLLGAVFINKIQKRNPQDGPALIGDQFGSYFGYALATADLDGDGNDDELIVGAPFYTPDSTNHDHNPSQEFNSGCVFIYRIDFSTTLFYKMLARLCLEEEPSSSSSFARFGSAITRLGDINFDMKQDFAVAAPYSDHGVGSIYIYYGSLSLSSSKPAQVIRGRAFNNIPNLRGFGTFLLSENLDVDGNGTPDLAVSSFESNHVVILRTRPVAKPTISVSYHSEGSLDAAGKIYRFLPSPKESRFRVRICINFTFSIELLHRDFKLDSGIKFEVDKLAYFDDGKGYEAKYELYATKQTCLDRYMKIHQNLLGDRSKPKFLQFRTELSYNTPKLQSAPNLTLKLTHPSSESEPTFSDAFNSFHPYLPASIPPTFSDWESLEIANDNCNSDGKPDCDPKLGLEILDIYFEDGNHTRLPDTKSFVVGQVETIVLKMRLSNTHETAYHPTLRVALAFTDDFDLPKTEWRWQVKEGSGRIENFKGQIRESNGILNVEGIDRRSRPLQNDSHISYELHVSNLRQMKVSVSLEGKINLTIEAFPEGQREKEKVRKKLEILLKSGIDVEVQAVSPTTMGQTEIDPNTKLVDLTQIYILKNIGISSSAVDKIRVEILVPTHALVKNKLRQVIGIVNPSQFSFGMRCAPQHFSFFRLESPLSSEPESEYLYMKEEEGLPKPKPLPFFFSSHNFISLQGCNNNDDITLTYCRKIICFTDLSSMESKAIQIQMYLLPSAATELISDHPVGIRIKSLVFVYYLKSIVKKEGETWRKLKISKGISVWMVVVAACGGAVIFSLLTFVLYKVGFFKRHTKKQLNQLRRQTLPMLPMDEIPTVTENETGS